jgi:hypothetical protein
MRMEAESDEIDDGKVVSIFAFSFRRGFRIDSQMEYLRIGGKVGFVVVR